jgi:hypothetical protein
VIFNVELRVLPLHLERVFEDRICIHIKSLFLLVHSFNNFEVAFIDDVHSIRKVILVEEVGTPRLSHGSKL